MNTLKIKLNPYKDINIASLDEKPLSPYSELNNYMKEPFLKWADKLLDAAEREINDDYELVVVAEAFEEKFLLDLQNDFDACKEYKTDKFQVGYSVAERYTMLTQLANKYNITFNNTEYRIPIYTDIQLSLDESCVNPTPVEEATIIVTNNADTAKMVGSIEGMGMAILVGAVNCVKNIGDMKFIWEVSDERLVEVMECIVDRFAKIPMIVALADLIARQMDILEDADKEKVALATEVDMFVSVLDISDIEVGSTTNIEYKVIPEDGQIPTIRVISSNTNVVSIEGNTINAVSQGKAILEFYKAEENIPFVKKTITTFSDNSVKKIMLSIASEKMGIGRSQAVEIQFVPEDAEDINSLSWKVEGNAITVDDNGSIRALRDGKSTIIASTTNASASIDVEVLPNLSSIQLSVNQSNLYVGQTEPISVSVSPQNCFDASYEWKSSDKAVAIIDRDDAGKSVIRATGIGECVLTCEAVEGDCVASCSVKVESTFKKRENQHKALSLTAVLAVVAMFCAALSFPIGVFAAAVGTVVLGIIAIGKNKADRFWAFILMAIAVFMALESMGITNIF